MGGEARRACDSARRRRGVWLLTATAAMALLAPQGGEAQGLTYAAGQGMDPAFEGWEKNADGSYNFVFGYMNRNWEEELDIPIGPDNFLSPGPEDRGQPTHFLPRRNRFVFRVPMPAATSEEEQLVWTVTINGEEHKAYGSLAPDYFIDDIVLMSETGSIGNGHTDAEARTNMPPVSDLEGPTEFRVRVGEPVTLSVKASDDSIPRPRNGRVHRSVLTEAGELDLAQVGKPNLNVPGKVNGLHVSWFVYRGAGEVTFDPPQIKVWEDTRPFTNSPWSYGWIHPEPPADGRWVVRVTFHAPGTYVLRGKTDDGGLWVDHDVTIRVLDLVP